MNKYFLMLLIAAFLFSGCINSPDTNGLENAPAAGSIETKGSDTMVNLALAWAEAYRIIRPEVRISVTGGGSGTGIASLINNSVDFANASREIKSEELQNAEKNGIEPVEFVVAKDAIAIIVNPGNPIDQLTLQQVSDIYSGKINNWKELGGDDLEIVRLSRETNSGTHVYFLEQVLRLGNSEDKTLFAANTLLLPSSEGITQEVRENPHAIGYDGLGYITAEEKVISIARNSGEAYIYPSAETVIDGSYPIARDLYMYSAGIPKGVNAEYLNWILSPDAQQIVKSLGFVPIQPK